MLKQIVSFVLLLIAANQSFAQRTCGTDSVHAHMMGFPAYEDAWRAQRLAQNAVLEDISNRSECDNPLILPVAVHFQNTGIPLDCATEMALSQIESLNQDFSATNPDISEWEALQPSIWPGISNAESCIQFCLATLDHPAGYGLSDGDYAITLDAINGDNAPDWSGYINFFVYDIGGGILGYSPLGGMGNGDGITCDPAYFGSVSCGGNNIDGTYNLGRTVTHEVGHYMSLEHPWGNGGCGSTDFVNDTPVTDNPQYGCPAGQTIVNCTDPILWPSYMDYCDDACLFMFSAGQVARMESHVTANLQNVLTNAVTTCQEAGCIDFDVAVSHQDESCAGGDGIIQASASGGATPYTFDLNGSAGGNGTFNNLVEGDYDLYVTDDAGCEFSTTISLDRNGPSLALTGLAHEYCSDGTGAIEVTANEPSPFSFTLNTGATSPTGNFDNLPAGDYIVTAANNTGCSGTVLATVQNESDLILDVEEVRDVSCSWVDNGAIVVKAVGGMEPLAYTFNGQEASGNGRFEGLAAGSYEVTVLDAAGCFAAGTFDLGTDFSSPGEDCPCMVYVPAAFSPDGDMLNENLRIEASCPVSDVHLEIFDRWGGQIHESFSLDTRWNGGVAGYYVDAGVYHYRLTYKWGEAGSTTGVPELSQGTIMVIR